ncbi:serine/threonine-protein kinase CTR1 [Ricinus communis]|uniref:serine/threonine-protein kinase CTR1 n=1 Tax=Ricinus communis TaxID=3988 RepID=UPI00201AA4F6|nr:serine/threonine-protein kinase CTR1 [Ricinus communis]
MEYGYWSGETTGTAQTATFSRWVQQTEESYQLQLALALRLSSQAALANDSNFLDFKSNDHDHYHQLSSSSNSAESVSHRFWVNGCLSYYDRIPDGFYVIHGVDPYAWTISIDQKDIGLIPSFESLKALDPRDDLSVNVVLIDRFRDPSLKELSNRVIKLSSNWITTKDAIDQLADLVCNRMGGVTSTEQNTFDMCWKECTEILRNRLGSVVLPIGNLPVGLCVHRALLFKVLADSINLPCRIAKGCKHCRRDVAASCLVQVGSEREYLVDLFGKPGTLSQPDSSLNRTSSILVSSPLSHPSFKSLQTADDLRTLAKHFFIDSQLLNLAFDDTPSGTIDQDDKNSKTVIKDNKNLIPNSSNSHDASTPPLLKRVAGNITNASGLHAVNSSSKSNSLSKDLILPNPALPIMHRDPYSISVTSNPKPDATNNQLFLDANQSFVSRSSSELHLEEEDLDIPWSELVIKEKIGEGSFGTVHRADWRGSDVAVKILMEQDYHAEHFNEFLREVTIMKRLRHPNIVLFMGAVTQPPKFSIVTEYLSRGSLHKLLHMPDARIILDEKRRLNMAYDVAKGMNYLHQLRPPIVHRDLKSLNLLVDSQYTVKVCDFGLSRSKAKTYLSSKTAAGTPEWMAPEVLRNEPSDEKSDVYSFGVILWELMTLQQPWRSLNQAQVVAAVGFKNQRLEIPNNINPSVAALIDRCLTSEPSKRPSFSYIMETLQKVIKNSVSQPVNFQIT